MSIDSLKYAIKHNKLHVNKINVKLKDIASAYPTYEMNMNGVVTMSTNNSGSQQELPNNAASEQLHKENVDVK